MAYGFLAAGLFLLIVGSEAAIRGGVGLARASGLAPLTIGLFVISAATSAPELAVSLKAGLSGAPDIAVGNVVGSNLLNLLPILGLGALIRPMPSPPKVVLRDGGTMLIVSVVLALMAWGGTITRSEGAFLLVGLFAYLMIAFFTDWRRPVDQSVACTQALSRIGGDTPTAVGGLLYLAFGVVAIALGAHFAVGGGIRLAQHLNVPQSLIGLTVIAFGTSLPELILTVVAVMRREPNLAAGHLIGASIFNILGVLGLTALLRPLPIAPMFAQVDILVMFGASALLLPMLATSWRLSRLQGFALLLGYLGYLASLAWRQGWLTPGMLHLG